MEAAVGYIFPTSMGIGDNPPIAHDLELAHEVSEDDEPSRSYKMSFIVNHSLKMGVGKIAAQVFSLFCVYLLIFVGFFRLPMLV